MTAHKFDFKHFRTFGRSCGKGGFHPFRPHRHYTVGLVLFCIGIGMIIQLLMPPAWGFLLAAGLVIVGFWIAFL